MAIIFPPPPYTGIGLLGPLDNAERKTQHDLECDFAFFGSALDGLHDTAQYKTRARIVIAAKANPPKTIARTKRFFPYRDEPGVLMLDHDRSPYGPAMTAEKLQSILAGTCRAFDNAACLFRGSVSRGVHLIGEAPKESASFHLYYAVLDASDIPRFGDVLFKRLWLARYGYIALTKNGVMLIRAVIDGAVFSSERLDFTGRPVIESDDLEYTPPKSEYRAGGYLDTSVLPDLSRGEEIKYRQSIVKAKEVIRPRADKVRDAWVGERVPELVNAETRSV